MAETLLTALALVLVIEGVLYALFPSGMQRMVAQVLTVTPAALRTAGLLATVIGVGIVWLMRG